MLQKICQVFINVKLIGLCHLDHCVDQCTGNGTFWSCAEQPVFPSNCNRFFFFKTIGFSLLKCMLLVLWSALVLKKLWPELDSMYCRIAVIILLPFWSRINGLYSCIRPTGTFTLSQYKAHWKLWYRLAWKLRKYLDCFGKKQWIRFVWNAQIHVSNH